MDGIHCEGGLRSLRQEKILKRFTVSGMNEENQKNGQLSIGVQLNKVVLVKKLKSLIC